MRPELASRLGAVRADIAIRVLADVVAILVAVSLTVVAEIAAAFIAGDIGILPASSGVRMAQRWAGTAVWWTLSVTTAAVAVFWVSDIYGRVRTYRIGAKIRSIAVTCGSLLAIWLLILQLVGDGFGVPRIGTVFSFLAVFAAVSGTRLTLAVLERAGVAESAPHARPADDRVRSVLVIGGAGYIGSVLCDVLLAAGYRVRVLDTLLFGDRGVARLRDRAGFELRRGDMRDLSALVAAAQDMDAIVHLGAIVGDPACEVSHDLTLEINLLSTRSIREVATALGVKRLVFASSCSVYGAAAETVNERSELHPVSLYGRTKMRSEDVLLAGSGRDPAVTVLRLATVYGLSPRPRFDLFANLFTAQAVTDGRLTVYGGEQWRPLLHVRDAALAIDRVLRSPRVAVAGEVFNVGSDRENHTVASIAEVVARIAGGASVLTVTSATDVRTYRVSFSKVHDVLGFEPTVPLETGVRELVAALRSGAIGDYRQAAYSNVAQLSASGSSLVARDRALMEMAESS